MSGPTKHLKINDQPLNEMVLPKLNATLTGIPREIPDLIYDYIFDEELIVWCTALTFQYRPRMSLLRGGLRKTVMSINKQIRDELSTRAFRIYAQTNAAAPASAIRLPTLPTPPVLAMMSLKIAAVDPNNHNLDTYYRSRLWQSNAELLRGAPKLEFLHIDVVDRVMDNFVHNWTMAEYFTQQRCFDRLVAELVRGHPALRSVTLKLHGVLKFYHRIWGWM